MSSDCEHLSVIEKSVYTDGHPVRRRFCTNCNAEVEPMPGDAILDDRVCHHLSIIDETVYPAGENPYVRWSCVDCGTEFKPVNDKSNRKGV